MKKITAGVEGAGRIGGGPLRTQCRVRLKRAFDGCLNGQVCRVRCGTLQADR